MTIDFFNQLSKFYPNENDLSNITCALCNSSMFIREKFIHFFFPQLNIDNIVSIKREVCDDNCMHSRVDIYITIAHDAKPWLIEVKIYDQNHHFGQYEAAYEIGKERLGYITNYVCKEGLECGYDVKTWSDWIDCLEKSVDGTTSLEERTLCLGYIEYVRKVCGLSNYVSSLCFDEESDGNFNEMLKLMLNSSVFVYRTKATTKIYKFQEYNVETFWLNLNEGVSYGGFLGYILLQSKPLICMGFCKILEKSKPIYNSLVSDPIHNGDICGECIKLKFFSSPTIIIPMSEMMHLRFLNSTSKSEQMEVMQEFVNHCFSQIIKRLKY